MDTNLPSPENQNQSPAIGKLLSRRQAAALLGVSLRTFERIINDDGNLPHLRIRGAVRIRADDLESYCRTATVVGKPKP